MGRDASPAGLFAPHMIRRPPGNIFERIVLFPSRVFDVFCCAPSFTS